MIPLIRAFWFVFQSSTPFYAMITEKLSKQELKSTDFSIFILTEILIGPKVNTNLLALNPHHASTQNRLPKKINYLSAQCWMNYFLSLKSCGLGKSSIPLHGWSRPSSIKLTFSIIDQVSGDIAFEAVYLLYSHRCVHIGWRLTRGRGRWRLTFWAWRRWEVLPEPDPHSSRH